MKRFLSLLVITVLIVCNSVIVFAGTDSAAGLNTDISTEKIDNINVQKLIDEYFDARESSLKNTRDDYSKKITTLVDDTKNQFLTKELERSNAKRQMEELFDFTVTDAKVYTHVKNVEKTSVNSVETYDIDVYEWTWIYYSDEEVSEVDRMGYGVDHKITVAPDNNGTYKIKNNIYDDQFVFDIDDKIEITTDEETLFVVETADTRALTPSSYNINDLIEYADRYVAHQYASSAGTSMTAYYNSSYYASTGSDCANYVSQCLKAAGMPLDLGSNNSYDSSSSSDWWYDSSRGSSLTACSSYSWRTVEGLIAYLENEGLTAKTINSSQSNIYPGNPVITGDEGHVAICVGYNSSGKPIINGHTRDVYHMPVVVGSGDKYQYTYQIFTSNTMGNTPAQSTLLDPTSTLKTNMVTIPKNESRYFNFTSTSSKTYQFEFGVNNTSSLCTMMIYKVSETSNGQTLYMVEKESMIARNGNTTFTLTLPAGTYYLRFYTDSSSSNTLTLKYKTI